MTWRVVVQGQTYETNLEELKQWVREGRILPNDQVFQPGVGWCTAGQLRELQEWFPPGVLMMASAPPETPLPPGMSPYSPTMPAPYVSPYTLPPTPYAPVYGQVGMYLSSNISLPGVPAGLGQRLLAAIVDLFLTFLCALPGLILIFSASPSAGRGADSGGQAILGYLLMYSGVIGYAILCALMTSNTGGSPGKKMLGLVVLGEDGQYISFGRAILREFLKSFFSNLCFLLNMWLLFDPRRQQLYDKILSINVYKAS